MNKRIETKQLAVIGLMTAVICILGPLSLPLPFSPVPISFANLAILLALYVLGFKRGMVSLFLYLLIGLVGVPVYSSFSSGAGKLLGPTGGYLIGYIFMALIAGFFIDKFFKKWYLCFLGMILGTLVLYIFGTLWLSHQAGLTFSAALAAGVLPFIPGDLAKIVISLLAGPAIRKALIRAHLF